MRFKPIAHHIGITLYYFSLEKASSRISKRNSFIPKEGSRTVQWKARTTDFCVNSLSAVWNGIFDQGPKSLTTLHFAEPKIRVQYPALAPFPGTIVQALTYTYPKSLPCTVRRHHSGRGLSPLSSARWMSRRPIEER